MSVFGRGRSETQAPRPMLRMGRGDVGFLAGAGVGFTSMDIGEAQAFHEYVVALRDRWMREHGRRLPHPDQLDRERYGDRQRRRERV